METKISAALRAHVAWEGIYFFSDIKVQFGLHNQHRCVIHFTLPPLIQHRLNITETIKTVTLCIKHKRISRSTTCLALQKRVKLNTTNGNKSKYKLAVCGCRMLYTISLISRCDVYCKKLSPLEAAVKRVTRNLCSCTAAKVERWGGDFYCLLQELSSG